MSVLSYIVTVTLKLEVLSTVEWLKFVCITIVYFIQSKMSILTYIFTIKLKLRDIVNELNDKKNYVHTINCL